MSRTYRIGLAQIDTTVGDLEGNTAKIRAGIAAARAAGCTIVALPELAVTGYPPEDLVLRRQFCAGSRASVAQIATETRGIIALVGFVDWTDDAYNAAAVLADGAWVDTYHKHHLPNYAVFDEDRYFANGRRLPLYQAEIRAPGSARAGLGAPAGVLPFGVLICEDIWYPDTPLGPLALEGAELVICLNASPYRMGKLADRERMIAQRAVDHSVAIAYVNAVGGQDELVFDGGSLVFGPSGTLLARGAQFREDLVVVDIDLDEVARARLQDPRRRSARRDSADTPRAPSAMPVERVDLACIPFSAPARPANARRPSAPALGLEAEVWGALGLGTRDYLRKTGFSKVIVGLSGGIDSALVAAVAVDAVGAGNVIGVRMPSRFSSGHSLEDAEQLACALGIDLLTIPIEPAHAAMREMMSAGIEPGSAAARAVADENLQARQRGNVLMTLSNARGWMVLSTGNKSEMAVGYATLYGDMCGGFAVIKDVPKTLVYRLARWYNARAGRDVIPARTIGKAPSAELRPDQKDTDSLPPYEVLDLVLEAYVERDLSIGEIVASGCDEAVVRRVATLVDRSEYKRRQAAPGVRITPRAFGKDRRYPIASAWRGAGDTR